MLFKRMVIVRFRRKPIIKEIHLGGGTPTFFSKKI
jgi:coproporphyrinogen III oxidase-like Fe-S oxidoreductase